MEFIKSLLKLYLEYLAIGSGLVMPVFLVYLAIAKLKDNAKDKEAEKARSEFKGLVEASQKIAEEQRKAAEEQRRIEEIRAGRIPVVSTDLKH